MKLIIGLGNIGTKYENTRHNVGFNILSVISRIHNEKFDLNNKLQSEIAKIKNLDIILAKPTTYMNNSGLAVSSLMNYYKIPLRNVIIIHDELDIFEHVIKIKLGGGNAGHNGLKSISQHCGNDYLRVRYGIGRPSPDSYIPIADFVLNKFSEESLKKIDIKAKIICDHIPLLFEEKLERFTSSINI